MSVTAVVQEATVSACVCANVVGVASADMLLYFCVLFCFCVSKKKEKKKRMGDGKRIGKEEVWWRHGKGKCNEQEDASS